MHLATLHLVPILGAEKSKVPFYVAGGVLVAWALVVSLGLGRAPDFPRTASAQRAVIAISAVLVLLAVGTAVITSGGSTKAEASASAPAGSATQAPANGEGSTPPTSPSSASTPASPAPLPKTASTKRPKRASTGPKSTTAPKATTGTPAPASATSTLKLAADPAGQLSYDTKQLSAKSGQVTIDFSNASPVEHNVAIAQGSKVLGQTPIKTGSATVTVALTPGTYTFYCAVPGHRQAGMEGTLTVS